MRRHGRSSGGPTKAVTPMSDTVSLIHSFDSVMNPNRPARPSPLASSNIKALPLELVDRLRSFPLFQATPESFLFEVGQHLRPQLHAANDYILTEGDEARAIYWLVRGAVSVTSRDGESIYAELQPGAFFGEIGVLMDRPRTATIVARTRCMLVVLTKEDFRSILPRFPDVERAIREEAQERLMILEKKKKETSAPAPDLLPAPARRGSKRLRESFARDLVVSDDEELGVNSVNKKRKSPSPGRRDGSSALANGLVNVRLLLKELPLFSGLPADILHFLGLNAQPRSFPPFTDIIQQDSHGRELYFIVRGEVEVVAEKTEKSEKHLPHTPNGVKRSGIEIKARLRQGQYFGEVVSLSLAPRRTATVRSVTQVECLMLSGDVLSELWAKCPSSIREQVERTAQERLQSAADGDVVMTDAANTQPSMSDLAIDDRVKVTSSRRRSMPLLTLTETELDGPHQSSPVEDQDQAVLRPTDPDPYLSLGLDKVRLRSRRGSVAPLTPEELSGEQARPSSSSEAKSASSSSSIGLPEMAGLSKPHQAARPLGDGYRGVFPDSVLLNIFQYLELHHLLRFRAVSSHWSEILNKSGGVLRDLDLSVYNRKVTDQVLVKIICPFVGTRPRSININNCFHITDEGFNALASTCAPQATTWKMKSVWEVTASAILEMSNKATKLQEADLSNCRKVGDTLLARIVGWVASANAKPPGDGKSSIKPTMQTADSIVYGCPQLKKLTLSYCKHVTDRSMHHIASHAAGRIEEMDLTRCTTITDQGFQYWGNARFTNLKRLCLADCTYLTDNAIVHLTNAAKSLQELDLSFCCALSDTATEVLALQCSQLKYLNMSFCGSAISDPSLRSIGLHLLSLQHLSVRGCVRVTGVGVEAVAEGCHQLQSFDVSQCKNLTSWLEDGGPARYRSRIDFEVVATNRKTLQ
ncbi:uncharacterized protein PFLUO_LOCUS4409 [Penicillium psychrofluorescens]|uniref:uncharacterized protein n=1 Tax=Penicillium psychrofluorescens TaxID=3158075 RepID=UPI003CCDF4A9